MTTLAKPEFVIGIDPGRQTGVGVLRYSDDKVIGWYTKNFFSVQGFLRTCYHPSQIKIIVEVNPKFMYRRNAGEKDQTRDRHMTDIGGVRREAELLAETLRRLGYTVYEVPPVREKKWDEKRFRLFTRSNKTANQHERDAVRLAFYYKNKR